jgi:hypothetical protein
MPKFDNAQVLDVTMDELPENMKEMVQQACDQFQHKCLMSFSKNKSNRVFQKRSLPRVLLPHQTDDTKEEDTQRMAELVYKAIGDTMTNHHSAFLNTFRAIMANTFGPTAEKYFEEAIGPMQGPTLFHVLKHQDKTARGSSAPNANKGGLELHEKLQPPTTCGQLAFSTTRNVPPSAFRVSLVANRLQKNMYGDGYQEFADYNVVDVYQEFAKD